MILCFDGIFSLNKTYNPGLVTCIIFYHDVSSSNYRGRKFILDHLRMEDVICYWEKLLRRYRKLMKWKPQRNSDFIMINSNK